MRGLVPVVVSAVFLVGVAPRAAEADCVGGAPDGNIAPSEDCDDNNNVNTDGCSNTCTINGEFTCARPLDFANLSTRNFAGSTAAWTVPPGGASGTQTQNTPFPTIAIFGEDAKRGTYTVQMGVNDPNNDDDFIGIVLGFNPGNETSATAADYIVIDWKRGLQNNVQPGLRLAHIRGLPAGGVGGGTHSEFQIPQRLCPNVNTSCTRQVTSGRRFANTGWVNNTADYDWQITYRSDRLEILIDGQPEFLITPADFPGEFTGNVFPSGQIGFYLLSQEQVTYTNLAPFAPSNCNVTQLNPLTAYATVGTPNVVINTAAQLQDTPDALQGNSVVVRSITNLSGGAGGTASVAANGNITFTPANPNLEAVYRLRVFACDDNDQVRDCDEEFFHVRYSPDRDGDGVSNGADLDDDDDGIPDRLENLLGINPDADADNDGVPNYLDRNNRGDGMAQVCTDANTDNICDAPGGDFDRDADGVPNHLDLDSDNDGILDVVEARAALPDNPRNGRMDCPGGYGTNGLCNAIETTPDSGVVDYNADGVGPDAALDSDSDLVPDFLDVDSDNDGIFDRVEGVAGAPLCPDANTDGRCEGTDADNDGVVTTYDGFAGLGTNSYATAPNTDGTDGPDFRDTDADGDSILDSIEGTADTDGDTRPDYRDLDSDDDGIRDAAEGGTRDTDGDGRLDFRDLDSDNDGIPDLREGSSGCADANNNGRCDGADANSDGLKDGATNPTPPDTDGDSAPDFRDLDSDNDGLTDLVEGGSGCTDTTPVDAVCDGPDANNDGIVNTVTIIASPDTDGDTVPDFRDLDSDDDGLVDLLEGGSECLDANGNAVCDGPDTDGDGIADSIDDLPAGFGDTMPTIPTNSDGADLADFRDPDSNNDGVGDFVDSGCTDANSDQRCDGLDTDRDGVVDSEDGFDGFGILKDTDGDGVSDAQDLDDDNDGIPDTEEGSGLVDTDGDGIPDSEDLDSDNDGLADVIEAGHRGLDANADGIVDCQGGVGVNGFCDALETAQDNGIARDDARDTDADGVTDFRDLDSDDDGISDRAENGSSCADADIDGVCDGVDSDRDGVVDSADGTVGFGFGLGFVPTPPDTDLDGTPNYRDLDSDGDGIPDIIEGGRGSADGNRDGKADGADTDGDGIKDGVDGKPTFGGAGNSLDTDGDGTTDERDLDSDNDGITDTDEAGEDPTDPNDTDGDGTPDFQDVDSDADATGDDVDNCRLIDNADQADADDDGIGDACDDDDNNDGIEDGIGVQGGGCSTSGSGGASTGGLVVLAFAAMLMRRRRAGRIAAGAVSVLAASTGAAAAQAAVSSEYGAERFQLTGHRDGILAVEWADVHGHLAFDFGLWFGYANDPVNLYQMSTGERVGSLVSDRYGGDIVAAVQLWHRFELGIGAPIIVSQDNDLGGAGAMPTDMSGFGLGDLRLSPKLTLLKQGRSPIAIAAMAMITLPTSTSDDYGGDDGVTVSPSLVISAGKRRGARFSLQGGYRVRPEAQSLDLVVDDEVFGAVGLGYRFQSSLEIDASFDVATAADDVFGAFNRNAAEVRAGIGYDIANLVRLFAVGGLGVAEGFATPDWRALVGLRLHTPDGEKKEYRPLPRPLPEDTDPDRDGIVGTADRCPDDPEDMDGFEDGDGCPDVDNDKDTVLDVNDACRDVFGLVDNKGCPDPDRDGDTVVDRLDVCPDVPGVAALQGCPDRDGDTVADAQDNCPDEPGPVENAGCKKKQLVKITGDKLEILDIVYFALNKAAIQKRSNALLDNVAEVLVAHPEITKIVVEGHTDSQGNDAYNKKLSQSRANAVMAYLVKKGVTKDRLEAVGYGEERPKDTNDTKEGRAVNRRVEFTIVGGVGVKVDATGPDGTTSEK